MSSTYEKSILLTGSSFGWLHYQETEGETTVIKELLFDNLQSSSFKMKKPGTASGGETIDIQRADGAIIRFPKMPLVIDGITEEDITEVSETESKGEITIVTNEAPYTYVLVDVEGTPTKTKSTMYWTEFLKVMKTLLNKEFLITIATGHSQYSRISADRQPDGYVHLIGKITNDIEQTFSNNAGSLSLTIAGIANSAFTTAQLQSDTLFTEITDKRGTGKNVSGIKPLAITETLADEILAGECSLALVRQ